MNILQIQQTINEDKKRIATILNRRVMMKLAEKLAKNMEYQCLITGSLGQVASQTMGGFDLYKNDVVQSMPVFSR